MRARPLLMLFVAYFQLYSGDSLFAQLASEKIDLEVVAKIKDEGLNRSQVMQTISYLTDVHGPRLTGSPITRRAGQWTQGKLTEWGLVGARLEPWGPFGRGWTLEAFTANLVEPSYSPLIAYPKAWSPSTPKTIRGEPLYFDAEKTEDLQKFRGKLHRAIVLMSKPREIKALFNPPATRKTDQELLELANADASTRRRRSSNSGATGSANPTTTPGTGATMGPEQLRGRIQLQADKWQMAYDEGAAVVLEPGQGDGGTVFVASVTMPRRADANRNAPGGQADSPFSRGPRPWATEDSEILPQVVLAAEHYNRLVRMIEKGAHPKVEIDIASRYYNDDLNSFNIIAEIPGSDLKDEIVMLGAHFDSWHSGTGATDNAVGCGVAMEAVRILKAVGATPRRTVRIALWTGEEQGLLGSKAYVSEHFGKVVSPSGAIGAGERSGGTSEVSAQSNGSGENNQRESRSRTKYELKPAHEKFAAYFNLDNGTGKVRGVHLQGNEALRPMFRAWLAPFAEMGASTVTHANTGGTDHLSFDAIGLPGFQFIQDPLEYDSRTHHSSMDVYERIQEEDVKQAAIIMASFVYQAATRDEKLIRKPLDGEVVQ